MENAKYIGGIGALAVALGMGMAVANTPAVALAAPADSGEGSSGGSSQSSSSHDSGSTSADTNDPASHRPRPLKPHGLVNRSGSSASAATTALTSTVTPATPETRGTDARRSGRVTFRPTSGNTSMKTGPNPAPLAALTSPPVSSTAAAPAIAPPSRASLVITPTPAEPSSGLVSTLINAVLSPFANSAPTAPVQSPAAWTLLAFARRDFEQALSMPSTTVNPLAGQTTNGLVADTVAVTSEATISVADPDFISSTHNLGLFSITSAGDPDDNNYVAVVFSTPFFTNILTSGTDPEDNLGFGAASIGVAGQTVNTFMSPFLNLSIAIPVTDPFAELFITLIRLGIV